MTTNPWDVLDASQLEKNPDALYRSIGHALSSWESMEQQFSYLFGYFCSGCTGYDEARPSKRAWGAVITFRGRSDLLRAAAAAYFEDLEDHKMKGRFFELLKRAGDFSARRNEIAHGYVTNVCFQYEDGDTPQKVSIERSIAAMRWLHCPPEYATNKNVPDVREGQKIMRRKYAYSTVEIDHYRKQFEQLRNDIWTLVIDWSQEYPEADILPPM